MAVTERDGAVRASARDRARSWQRRLQLPAAIGEVLLAMLVAVLVDLAIAVAQEPGATPTDVVAYALGGVIGLLVLGRKRWPIVMLAATTATMVVYYSLGYPGLSPAIPVAVALYSAVVAGWMRWSLTVCGFFVFVGFVVQLINREEPPLHIAVSMVQVAALLGAIVLLGHAVRMRRIRLAEADERLRLVEADREAAAARRVAAERLRIARELHDVLGHTTTLISVQAQVAADALADDPRQARDALDVIRSASREAMTELKGTVELLREDGAAPRTPTPGLDQLDELRATARDAGVLVRIAFSGEKRAIPVATELAAYRIVQEALTNVVRHADADRATVTIEYIPDAVVVDVLDNGTGGGQQSVAQGHGIAGMTERAEGLGGSLHAEQDAGGGFRIHAGLPAAGAAA